MNEFDLIKKYLSPLARGFSGSLNLTDDAAVLDIPAGKQLVVTKDALIAGVHFLGDEDPALIAKKALRVNLSDLAAMGAAPYCYFLALMLPHDTKPEFLERFAQGLGEDQKEFAISLAGGDTTATTGALSLSITALGLVDSGKALTRSGAKIGDGVYVSGTIGDSALGLASLQKKLDSRFRGNDKDFTEQRYLLPQPRLALGKELIGIATSCMDISDGLVQDVGHICAASGVGAAIERDKIPLSDAAKANLDWNAILGGGDDYELLFTTPPDKEAMLEGGVTRIGTITQAGGVVVLDETGKTVPAPKGFRHF